MRKATKDAKRRAFEQEALPHLDALYGTALRLTRSPAEAEDLVQDSLLKAFRFFDQFQPGSNMKAWLLKIETNTFINRYRRVVRERKVFDGALADPVGEGVMSRAAMRGLTHATAEADRRLLAAEIQRALDALPEEHRTMIVLADIEELSYREVADVVGCPIGTVMSRLHRARRSMQEHLVEQAIQFGIVDGEPDVAANDGDAPPVSLEAYRRRKEAAG
ncbi:MAG: sigma-70 family RNA polymerase sigma factor [Myxococcales bacterium]|nr:sigma-70 family RNA polymerase sigma factor [Myxococcales bacterium]